MMTANKELFLWDKDDSWWYYDKDGKVVLTEKAPEEARKSFELYKKKMNQK